MKNLFFIGAMWLICMWLHAYLGFNVLPAPGPDRWWSLPMILTHIVVFMGYTFAFLQWGVLIWWHKND